jgi:hypothetical protein
MGYGCGHAQIGVTIRARVPGRIGAVKSGAESLLSFGDLPALAGSAVQAPLARLHFRDATPLASA